MADQRTFTLIGNFTDNITPALESINKSIDKLRKNLDSLSSVTKPLKSDFKELAGLSKDFSHSLQGQAKDIRDMTSAMKAFRAEMGRTNRAYRAGGSRLARAGRAVTPTPSPVTPITPTRRRGVSGGGGGGYTAAVAGGILGTQLSSAITGAIVQGFQLGTALMMKPFQYFQQALGERINDEMSDLRAAGGYFAIAKRQKDPFVTTMDEAIQYTQKNNQVLAKLASALPGSTQDYIEVSKRLSDTITRVVSKDLAGAIKEANRIRATEEGAKFYGGQITGTGKTAQQDAITTLLAEMTKKTVLAGFGGRAGAGGAMGPYGLPGLTERLISQDQVSVSQFQRYAAIFSDPQILDALTRNIDKVNATGKDSIDRYKALEQLYAEILPPELISKFRRSIKGINEALYSAALNPEVGFLGLGRKIEGLGRQMNDLGQYVDETGKVVADVNGAAKVNLSVFELLRDIYAQTAQVLTPIIDYLPLLWDPLKKIGLSLSDARHYTGQFLQSFNAYKEGFKNLAKDLGGTAQLKIMQSLDIRASLMALTNMLAEIGAINMSKFTTISDQLKDPNANIGNVMNTVIKEFFSSEAATELGRFLGNLIGTVLRQVADAAKYISGTIESGGFAGGFASAFSKAGGFAAIQDIFVSIIKLFIKALGTAITEMPLLTGTVAALALLPTIIGAGVTNLVERCMGSIAGAGCALPGAKGGLKGRRGRGAQGLAPTIGEGGMFQTPAMRRAQLRAMARARRASRSVGQAADIAYSFAGRPGAGLFGKAAGAVSKVGKFVPGGALAAGAIDMGLALASGENFGKAAASSIGTVLGGTAGSIFGPVGTIIGSMAGGILADAIVDSFKVPSYAQEQAARMQEQAAVQQMQAAKLQAGGLKPEAATYAFGTVEQFAQRLDSLGLTLNKDTLGISNLYAQREASAKAAFEASKVLNTEIERLRAAKISPDLIAKQVAPLQKQFNIASANLASSQSKFDVAFRKLPNSIQSAIMTSLSRVSFKGVENIINAKFSELKFQTGPFPGLTLNPQLIEQYVDRTRDKVNDLPGKPVPSLSAFSFKPQPRALPNAGFAYGFNEPAFFTRKKDAVKWEQKHLGTNVKSITTNSAELSNLVAQVRYGGNAPKPGGGSANWMQILEEDYKKNLNKPYNPSGTVRNSGRGGLDTWGGPGAYVNPKTLTPVASAGGGGGPVSVSAPITINQQPGQNAEELAAIVAMKIGDAVAEARASSMFV